MKGKKETKGFNYLF